MTTKRYLKLVTAAAVSAVLLAPQLSSANDVERNPLHPQHFWSQVQVEPYIGAAIVSTAIDTGNPLHPGYKRRYEANVAEVYKGAGTTPTRDTTNPLHPTYARL